MAKRKDVPSSVLTRSRRETSTRIQASTNPLNTRKSPRFHNQMGPTPSTVKKKPEKNEKHMGSTPLRRSGRGKNPVDVPASNVKTTEKSADISEESAEDGSPVSNGSSKIRKRYHATEFKARYKSQLVRVETEGSEVLAHIESQSSSGDQFWSAAVSNGTPVANETPDGNSSSLYQHLKPTLSELCNILKLSEGAKKKRENHGSSNEEALQSSGQILDEDIARMERNEIDKFHGEWDAKKMNILNDFRLEKALIRYLHGSNSSVRSEKLNLVEKEFADQLNEHERLRQVYFNDLINDEISLNGPAHETQIVDLVEGEKEDQESREVPPAGNPIEAESHDKPMHDKCPVVVPDGVVNLGDSSNDMMPGSHTSEMRMTNATSGADATVLSESIGDIPAKDDADMGNDVVGADATVSSKPIGNDAAPQVDFSADGSDAVEERARDTTPSVQQVVSPVSDHSMPPIPEIHNDSHLLQQPSKNGIQDQEGQADPSLMVEIEDDNKQPVDQIILEGSSLNPHVEPSSSVMPANPTVTENQAAMLLTSEVLAQTTAAQTQLQNVSLLDQYIFDLQWNANSNQVDPQMTRRVDPLHFELEQLSSVKEKMVKSYNDNIKRINIDCEKEIAEAIAEIRLKYCNKHREADATFNSQKKEVENNMNTVAINQVLAATYRHKRQHASRGCAALQACQAESMQQQHRFRGPSTCLLGQFSGTQQAPPPIPATAVATPPPQTQPPLQIVHQPSTLFLTPLTRHPHTNNLRPANTTPIRPPPNTETCGQSPQSRPLVSREIQIPGPHMRPLANSDVRSSTLPMRPSIPASSSGPLGSGTYHKTLLPIQHVTSTVPLTSPLNSQPLNSTSSVQPLPPPQQPRSGSPHASVGAASAQSSLPRGPSVPQSRRPQDMLNDNVNTLTYNATRALNILKTPEFQGGGNAAQPPSAHEVVYLSDDDLAVDY